MVVIAVLTVSGCASAAALTVLYTNDLHLCFDRLDSLQERIVQERDAADGGVLLLDAGDALHDFRRATAAVSGADEMVAWMNDVAYDAMAVGNHDLYWGSNSLEALASAARFPFLCANLVPCAGVAAPFVDCTVVDRTDVRVLVIGLITSELLPYAEYPWLSWADPTEAIRAVLGETGDGMDVTIVLCHLPVDRAARLAEQFPEVNLFISGHSHEVTPDPVLVNGAAVVQAGAFGRYLGRLRLEVETNGTVLLVEHTLLDTEETPARELRGLGRLLCVTAIMLATLALVLF